MIKEITKVDMPEGFKEKAINLIEDTINNVMDSHHEKIDDSTVNKIKNLTLDQINVNVTTRANLRTLWVINVEDSIPVSIEKEIAIPVLGELFPRETNGKYKMKSNLTWTYNEKNNEEGLSEKEFQSKILEMILEDIETAVFYGALSYVGDST